MKKNKQLISIIVPVYNVEKYLEKCINSLVNQSYQNLEIILIDDGSTDNSGKICDKFSNKDERIRVIHKKNEGQSIARNLGLEIAAGELIGFVDSDDYIDLNMYEILYNTMLKNNADVVECAVENIYIDRIEKKESNQVISLSGIDALERHLSKDKDVPKPRAAVWSRLYKKNVINGLEFPIGKIHEDFYFTYRTLLNTKRYCWIDKCLYSHIYTNTTSTTQLPFSKKDLAKIDIFEERMNYLFKNDYVHLGRQAEIHYFELLLQHYYKANNAGLTKEAKEIRKNILKNKLRIDTLDFSHRKNFEFKLLFYMPPLYNLIRTIHSKFN